MGGISAGNERADGALPRCDDRSQSACAGNALSFRTAGGGLCAGNTASSAGRKQEAPRTARE